MYAKKFWYQEQQRLLNNEPPTRSWTSEQIRDILAAKNLNLMGNQVSLCIFRTKVIFSLTLD
ncbi:MULTISPECIES: hypothetical protein [Bacillus]|uniref:hypothetical protein n=1 Tax=Bacillus TaxID=1386 RepID=UPI0011459FBB